MPVEVKTAGNRAGIDDGQITAVNADAANTAICGKTRRRGPAIAALEEARVDDRRRPGDAAADAAGSTSAAGQTSAAAITNGVAAIAGAARVAKNGDAIRTSATIDFAIIGNAVSTRDIAPSAADAAGPIAARAAAAANAGAAAAAAAAAAADIAAAATSTATANAGAAPAAAGGAITGVTLAAFAATEDRAGCIGEGERLADVGARAPVGLIIGPVGAASAAGDAAKATAAAAASANNRATCVTRASRIPAGAPAGGRAAVTAKAGIGAVCATRAYSDWGRLRRVPDVRRGDGRKNCLCSNCQDHGGKRRGAQQERAARAAGASHHGAGRGTDFPRCLAYARQRINVPATRHRSRHGQDFPRFRPRIRSSPQNRTEQMGPNHRVVPPKPSVIALAHAPWHNNKGGALPAEIRQKCDSEAIGAGATQQPNKSADRVRFATPMPQPLWSCPLKAFYIAESFLRNQIPGNITLRRRNQIRRRIEFGVCTWVSEARKTFEDMSGRSVDPRTFAAPFSFHFWPSAVRFDIAVSHFEPEPPVSCQHE